MARTLSPSIHRTRFRRAGFATLVLAFLTSALLHGGAGQEAVVREPLRPSGIDGALVICGGKLPDAVTDRFLQLAGGADAHLVIIPTASASADKEPEEKFLAPWKERKPASVVMLHMRSRQKADDAAFVEPLKKATGVWFGGGVQSRIAEAYLGTAVEKELHALLKRGGVIGGTSAGAAVMTKLMIAGGNPEAKTAPGFDFLPCAVIDQHFLKRDRKARLLGVLEKNPGHMGVGIDEGTALIVKGHVAEVVGRSSVHFYDRRKPLREGQPDYEAVKAGQRYDLQARRVVEPEKKE